MCFCTIAVVMCVFVVAGSDIQVLLRMNCITFGDPLTFSLPPPPAGQIPAKRTTYKDKHHLYFGFMTN